MKIIIVALFIVSHALMSCAQDVNPGDVPSVVLNTFQSGFPDARDIEWEKRSDIYEVEFDMKNVDYQAFLDASGKLILSKHDIPANDLPQAVKNTIQADFKDYRIDDAELVEKDGETLYEVELEGKIADRQVVFTQGGQVTENAYSFRD